MIRGLLETDAFWVDLVLRTEFSGIALVGFFITSTLEHNSLHPH